MKNGRRLGRASEAMEPPTVSRFLYQVQDIANKKRKSRLFCSIFHRLIPSIPWDEKRECLTLCSEREAFASPLGMDSGEEALESPEEEAGEHHGDGQGQGPVQQQVAHGRPLQSGSV